MQRKYLLIVAFASTYPAGRRTLVMTCVVTLTTTCGKSISQQPRRKPLTAEVAKKNAKIAEPTPCSPFLSVLRVLSLRPSRSKALSHPSLQASAPCWRLASEGRPESSRAHTAYPPTSYKVWSDPHLRSRAIPTTCFPDLPP